MHLVDRVKEDHEDRRDDARHDAADHQEELREVFPRPRPGLHVSAPARSSHQRRMDIEIRLFPFPAKCYPGTRTSICR